MDAVEGAGRQKDVTLPQRQEQSPSLARAANYIREIASIVLSCFVLSILRCVSFMVCVDFARHGPMQRPRILSMSVDAPSKLGGVARLAGELTRALAERHADYAALVSPGVAPAKDAGNLELVTDFQSDTRLREGPLARFEDDRIADFTMQLIQANEISHLILWHGFYYGPGAIRAAWLANIDATVFVHGTELTSQFPELLGLPRHDTPFLHMSLRNRYLDVLNRSQRVLTNSEFTADLVRMLVPNAEIHAVGCGLVRNDWKREVELQPDYDPENKRTFRNRIELAERPTLIFLGRLVPHKNADFLVRVLAHLPEAQLILAGNGPLDEEIAELSTQLGVTDRIIREREFDDGRKWDLLRAADIGLLPSGIDQETAGFEGFGIAMLEYAAAASCPISSGIAGLSAIEKRVGPPPFPIDPSGDPASCANNIRVLLANPQRISARVSCVRELFSLGFLWDDIADRISSVIQ